MSEQTENFFLPANETHIWFAQLGDYVGSIPTFETILSAGETKKSRNFHKNIDIQRYIVCRGILKFLLSLYSRQRAEKIKFGYNEKGKPFLDHHSKGGIVDFNISHSGDFALFAFTRNRKIGIDIEEIKDLSDMSHIIELIFSKKEKTRLRFSQGNEKKYIFYQYWTRKEALLKATGDGFSRDPSTIDICGNSPFTLAPKQSTSTGRREASFFLKDLTICPNTAAAVAVEGNLIQFRFFSQKDTKRTTEMACRSNKLEIFSTYPDQTLTAAPNRLMARSNSL